MKNLHIFGSINELLEGLAAIAKKNNWLVSLRTSERLKPLKKPAVPIFIANDLESAMRLGPPVEKGDVAISLGSPWIFSAEWISQWKGQVYNFHARDLPRHQGAGGASWLILMSERKGCATLHRIVPKIDSGEIIGQLKFLYPLTCVLPGDYDALEAKYSLKLAQAWIPKILNGALPKGKAQKVEESSYWPRLSTPVHGFIDWNWEARDIVSFCRAFSEPYEGAKTFLQSNCCYLLKVEMGKDRGFHPFQSGLIYKIDKGSLFVAARGRNLIVKEYRKEVPEQKIKLGHRFFTPIAQLEKAKESSVSYLPDGKVKIL